MPEPDAAAPGGRLKPTSDRGPTISDNPAAVPERRRPYPPQPLDSLVRATGEVTAFRRRDEETVTEMAEALRAHLDLPGLLTEDQRESDPARYRQHVLHARSDGSFSSLALGPLLAGAVLVIGGTAGAFTAAGALFALSLVTLLTLRTASRAEVSRRGSAWDELRDGLRYVRRHRMLAPLVTMIGLSEMCFSGPVATGLVLLADERGWGASGMGWVASAFSAGAAASALLLTVLTRIPRAGLAMCGALLVTAAGAVALGHAPSLPVAVVFGFSIGLTSGFTTTVTGAFVQTETDPRYLGRVTSVTTLCTLGLAPVLFPAVGMTVALWGAEVFFIGCGAISLLAAALGLCVPLIRRAEPHPTRPASTAGR
ncbi:MFS transporter [Streptomyces sp. CA-278952]|uniref:MFS transporter n=1 Tax=Streptomyces sp. CA-278952 TaxID=2980556 RepID=UPI002367B130|nr:MFS transporter [Streptomyces sp. CA-278952]WDG27012.1 MFS transporter [Streptomyces sp. CA-278952]